MPNICNILMTNKQLEPYHTVSLLNKILDLKTIAIKQGEYDLGLNSVGICDT